MAKVKDERPRVANHWSIQRAILTLALLELLADQAKIRKKELFGTRRHHASSRESHRATVMTLASGETPLCCQLNSLSLEKV